LALGNVRFGSKQTSKHLRAMSALPPKADIGAQPRNVRFVPKFDCNRGLIGKNRGDDPEGLSPATKLGGARTHIAVPMLKEGKIAGRIAN
jgi:hypothetical protein